MWSGPRNISTAMMRAWGNRPDTIVCDEPFYAYYLQRTGLAHPGADEVIRHHETDWRKTMVQLADLPVSKPIYYQKHMAHHMLPEMDRAWLDRVANAFLIREPREMLLSLVKNVPQPTLADTGLSQQEEIFDQVSQRSGSVPPVIDARDVLEDPPGVLSRLCARLGVPFLDCMLSWPAGSRETDGIWAKHWYEAVEKSTGFERYRPRTGELRPDLMPLLRRCEETYAHLYAHRL